MNDQDTGTMYYVSSKTQVTLVPFPIVYFDNNSDDFNNSGTSVIHTGTALFKH